MSLLPMTLPPTAMSEPLACRGKNNRASPVTTRGYTTPVRTHRMSVSVTAGRTCPRNSDGIASHQPERDEQHIDHLDPDERDHETARAVEEQVAPQDRRGRCRMVAHPAQCQRNERHDDQRV